MADGLSTVNAANAMLNGIRNVSWSNAATWIELHTASPGSSGTTAVSAGSSTRLQATYSVAAGGAIALSIPVGPWTNGGTLETITDVAVYSAVTGGVFLWSAPLTVPKTWASGDTLTLNSCGLSIIPIAV